MLEWLKSHLNEELKMFYFVKTNANYTGDKDHKKLCCLVKKNDVLFDSAAMN